MEDQLGSASGTVQASEQLLGPLGEEAFLQTVRLGHKKEAPEPVAVRRAPLAGPRPRRQGLAGKIYEARVSRDEGVLDDSGRLGVDAPSVCGPGRRGRGAVGGGSGAASVAVNDNGLGGSEERPKCGVIRSREVLEGESGRGQAVKRSGGGASVGGQLGGGQRSALERVRREPGAGWGISLCVQALDLEQD